MDREVKSVDRISRLKEFYTTVLSLNFSGDGKYLAAGLKSGNLAVYLIERLYETHENSSDFDPAFFQPAKIFQAHDGPIYALTSNHSHVISAGNGELKAWNWERLLCQESPEPECTISIFHSQIVVQDINALLFADQRCGGTLIAGCGDNKIYCYDMESSSPKLTLKGHEDYVNCLAVSDSKSQLYSGSEDGSVRIWDFRIGRQVDKIEPYKTQQLNRHYGKWIGSLAVDDSSDWLVCGGGPFLSSWHLKSLARGTVYHSSNETTSNTVHIHNDLVISGGDSPTVNVWNLNGETFSEVPCKPFAIYSIAVQTGERSIMAVAGCSYLIDICANFKYKDFSLEVTNGKLNSSSIASI